MPESGGKFNGEDRRGDSGTPEPSCYILLLSVVLGELVLFPALLRLLLLLLLLVLSWPTPKSLWREATCTWNEIVFKIHRWHQKKFVRREGCVKSLASELSTRLAFKIQKCQEQAGSIESGSTRQRFREQEMLRTRDRAVNDRASQAVTGRSYRLSLVFIGSSMFFLSKFPSSGLPGLYL